MRKIRRIESHIMTNNDRLAVIPTVIGSRARKALSKVSDEPLCEIERESLF